MQLQQLRYLVAAASCGSFRAAAEQLYVSQSSISAAVRDLEEELKTTVFERSRRGITVTDAGSELIGYARRVLREADAMSARYSGAEPDELRLVVSSLHNLLVTKAFGDFLDLHAGQSGDFELHETYTNQVIRDVAEGESALGIIYKSNFNDRAIEHALDENKLAFTPLFTTRPFVVVGDDHPLASEQAVVPQQLAPYDRYELEQGFESSSFYESEPISDIPHRRKIVLGDNSSLAALLAEHNGYSISSGLSPANRSLTLVPLQTDEQMTIGFIRPKGKSKNQLVEEFNVLLGRRVIAAVGPIEPCAEVYSLTRIQRPARGK